MGLFRPLGVLITLIFVSACTSLPIKKQHTDAQNKRIQSLVLHFTAGNYRDSMRALAGSGYVSSHYLIPSTRDATYPYSKLKIIQLVDEQDRAWHAGYSHWQGRDNLNDTSIGIEIVHQPICEKVYGNKVGGEYGPNQMCHFPEFEPQQMELLVELIQDILSRHPDIDATRIVGHSDIAPSRKSDPGPEFPWLQLHQAGIGAWYEETTFNLYQHMFAMHPPSLALTQKALKRYGYPIKVTGELDKSSQDVLFAFQTHFLPQQQSGVATSDTAAAVFALLEEYAPNLVAPLLDQYYAEAELMFAGNETTEQAPEQKLQQDVFYGLKNQGELLFSSSLYDTADFAINGVPLDLSKSRKVDMLNHQLSVGDYLRDGRNVLSFFGPTNEDFGRVAISAPELTESNSERLNRRFAPIKELANGGDIALGYKGQLVVHEHNLQGGKARSSGMVANHLTAQVATLQLIEQGLLQSSTPVSDYLPEYVGQGREFRTLAHLLNHTSGYPREFNLQDVRHNLAEFQLQKGAAALKPELPTQQLIHQHLPFAYGLGARREYSGLNDQIIADIIAKQSGQKYEDFIEATIVTPLKLEQTQIQSRASDFLQTERVPQLQIDASVLDLAKLGQLVLNQGSYGNKQWWSPGSQPISTHKLAECDLYVSDKALFVLDSAHGFLLVDEDHHLVLASLSDDTSRKATKKNACGLAPSQAELINMTYQMLFQMQSGSKGS